MSLLTKKEYNWVTSQRKARGLSLKGWFTPAQVGTKDAPSALGFVV